MLDLIKWAVDLDADDEISRTAAAELTNTLHRITGAATERDGTRIRLGHAGEVHGEGFRRRVAGDEIVLEGDGPRGLLYAVYDLLEDLGCAWPGPGIERIASGRQFTIGDRAERPNLDGRCLNICSPPFFEELDAWLTWAARNRLNTICIHVEPPDAGLGACAPWSTWEDSRATVRDACRRYGFALELGGHFASWLLPRTIFDEHPDAFRMSPEGERTPIKNLCVSSETALRTVRTRASGLASAYPEVDVFHLWADDLPGAGWCSCASCHELSAADQALRYTNTVADGVAAAGSSAVVTYLAYEDTEQPPSRVELETNVALLWAPMRRSYAAPASSPIDPQNRANFTERYATLRAALDPAVQQPVRIFEYYLGAITFPCLLPPLPGVLADDLAYYPWTGAAAVSALLCGPRRYLSPPVNAHLFATYAWDPSQDVDAALGAFGDAVFGGEGGEWAQYFRTMEAAFAAVIPVSPHQFPSPEEQAALMLDPAELYRQGLSDAQNPQYLPNAELHALLAAAAEAPALLVEADAIAERLRPRSDPARWDAERAERDLARIWISFVVARMELEVAERAGPDVEAATAYATARWLHEEALAWGQDHLSVAEVVQMTTLLHIMWRLPLDKVRLSHLDQEERASLERERDDETTRVFTLVLTGGAE